MSNLIRFEPIRELLSLREAMNQLFEESYIRPFSMSGGSAMPAIDVYQDNDRVVVKALLPGIESDAVEISVTGDLLTLKGEFHQENEQKDVTYILREQRFGAFERSIRLPTDVQAEKAKAAFESGVLTITLPKAEVVKPKTIKIK